MGHIYGAVESTARRQDLSSATAFRFKNWSKHAGQDASTYSFLSVLHIGIPSPCRLLHCVFCFVAQNIPDWSHSIAESIARVGPPTTTSNIPDIRYGGPQDLRLMDSQNEPSPGSSFSGSHE